MDAVLRAAGAVVLVAILVPLVVPITADRLRTRTVRWADRHRVGLTPVIEHELATALLRRSRVAVLVCAVTLPVAVALPGWSLDSLSPRLFGVAVSMGIAGSVAAVLELRRPWFGAAGPRTARLRQVRLEDYVSPVVRAGGWFAGVVCAVVGLVMCLHGQARDLPFHGLLTGAVVVALLVAEWSGHTLARAPEPARDAGQLYAQDAWRADAAQQGFRGLGTVGAMSIWAADGPQPLALTVVALGGIALMAVAGADRFDPAARMRDRLWPRLAPCETVGSAASEVGA